MPRRIDERRGEPTNYILTAGGLQRTLKLRHPEQTMHLWWTGAFLAKDVRAYVEPSGFVVETGEFLIEIELVRVEGEKATIRISAPEQVKIVSAKKDPHCASA